MLVQHKQNFYLGIGRSSYRFAVPFCAPRPPSPRAGRNILLPTIICILIAAVRSIHNLLTFFAFSFFPPFLFFSQEAKDHCVSSPCIEGQCLNTPGGYYCHCPPGRAGRHCEFPRVPCEKGGPCANGKCTFVSIFFFCLLLPVLTR